MDAAIPRLHLSVPPLHRNGAAAAIRRQSAANRRHGHFSGKAALRAPRRRWLPRESQSAARKAFSSWTLGSTAVGAARRSFRSPPGWPLLPPAPDLAIAVEHPGKAHVMVVRVLVGTWAALRAALIYGDAGRMMDQPLELWTRRDADLPRRALGERRRQSRRSRAGRPHRASRAILRALP